MSIRSFPGFRRLLTGLAMIALMLRSAMPVAAAAPSNDDIANATVVSALPFTDQINTLEATWAASDPEDCHNKGSVWYTFTPSATMSIYAYTFGSNYDTTLGVYSADGLTLIDCNDDTSGLQSQVVFEASGGMTYYFLVGYCCGTGSFGSDGGGGGGGGGASVAGGFGDLVFSVSETAPPLPGDGGGDCGGDGGGDCGDCGADCGGDCGDCGGGGGGGGSPLSPREQITVLRTEVQHLFTSKVLNKGRAHALLTKLDGTLAKLGRRNTKAPAHQLLAFVNQVKAFRKSGKLPPDQAQSLIDKANTVITQLRS